MTKRTIVTMPGDGIGNQVLPEAIRVLDAVGFEAEYVHADTGLGMLDQRGQCPSRSHPRPSASAQGRTVRRHHVQAEERGGSRTGSCSEGQGLPVLQPDRLDAAEVQPRYLHAAVPVISRQSPELHSQAASRWF